MDSEEIRMTHERLVRVELQVQHLVDRFEEHQESESSDRAIMRTHLEGLHSKLDKACSDLIRARWIITGVLGTIVFLWAAATGGVEKIIKLLKVIA